MVIIALVILIFGVLPFVLGKKLNLGLDLKGGIHLRMEVETKDALTAEADRIVGWLERNLKEEEISYKNVRRKEDYTVVVEGLNEESADSLAGYLNDNLPTWNYDISGSKCTLNMTSSKKNKTEERTIKQALQTIRNRINEYGVTEPTIQREGRGANRILVQLPGVEDPGRVKGLIKDTAFLEYQLLAGKRYPKKEQVVKQFEDGKVPDDVEILKSEDGYYYPLQKSAAVTGRDLMNSTTTTDRFNQPAVSFTLNKEGTSKIEKVSAEHIDEQMAVVLDDVVITAPRIRGKLSSNNQITGNFTMQEAKDLSLKLRAGALPAGMKYLEERTVGPSLGEDSIRQGVVAALLGFVLVMVFMLAFYRLSGINAIVALLINLLIIVGTMAYLGATLTLPGIAGYILTIGMAVDANVLVFERIKEELRAGKTPRSSVEGGFSKALSAIFDANITTLIAAVFLFQFGTGPVKGFAITLSIGILASLFTAIFVSRTIYEIVLGEPGQRVEKVSI